MTKRTNNRIIFASIALAISFFYIRNYSLSEGIVTPFVAYTMIANMFLLFFSLVYGLFARVTHLIFVSQGFSTVESDDENYRRSRQLEAYKVYKVLGIWVELDTQNG